jgi:hypothetical protein
MNSPDNDPSNSPAKADSAEGTSTATAEHFTPQSRNGTTSKLVLSIVVAVVIAAAFLVWKIAVPG